MKKLGSLILIIGLIFIANNLFAASKAGKIVYVDLSKVFQEHKKTKEANVVFNKKRIEKQVELEKMQKAISKMQEDFKKKEMVLSDEEKEKKREEINNKGREMQVFYSGTEREMNDLQAKLTRDILKDINNVIENIAKKKGYSMVINKEMSINKDSKVNIVLFAEDRLEITEDVIKGVNK